MLISVITPVYNAEACGRQAVESALMQPETGQVILIEDAPPDDSLRVCRELAMQHPRAVLLQHQDGQNHGAGASRNLAIKNARFPYIAFLDADDYLLSGRFSIAKELFEAEPAVEGVYEAVVTHFETPELEEQWRAARSGTQSSPYEQGLSDCRQSTSSNGTCGNGL